MKFFLWKKNKVNGTNGKKKPTSISTTHYMLHESCKQEFDDWPQALLAIGTLANSAAEDSFSFQKCTKEFKNELNRKLGDEEEENTNDLINEHLNSEYSSLETEGKEVETFSDVSNIKHGNFYPGNSLIHSRGRDLCYDNRKGGIGKKSLSFLLKKMFACKKGFQPAPYLKDPLSTDSRMEKILRAMLQKKIHPEGSSSTTFVKKYLGKNQMPKSLEEDEDDDHDDDDDEEEEEEISIATNNGSKWVKTDSEYIVLEI